MIGRRSIWCALYLLGLGCGGSDPSTAELEPLGTTHEELCAGAAERYGNIVTGIACPFERQVRNILTYGETIEPQVMIDASGETVATVTGSCDSWWFGKDRNDTPVILDADTGRILSHGIVDPGKPITELPGELPAPFSLR